MDGALQVSKRGVGKSLLDCLTDVPDVRSELVQRHWSRPTRGRHARQRSKMAVDLLQIQVGRAVLDGGANVGGRAGQDGAEIGIVS
jgi:hypothetical protein